MPVKRRFDPDPACLAVARNWTLAWAADQVGDPEETAAQDLVLIVSELMTNSIEASADQIEIELGRTDDLLTLYVRDDGRGWPTLLGGDPTDDHGRGLRLVAALTRHWGVTRDHDRRTTVWAHVPI